MRHPAEAVGNRVNGVFGTDKARFALLTLLVISTWKIGTPFFWRDDWLFLVRFSEGAAGFLVEPLGAHFFPVFKLVYGVVLRIAGVNVAVFQYVSLFVFAAVCWLQWRIASSVLSDGRLAAGAALLLAVHPVNFVAILWPFELCILLYLLFQLWALRLCLQGGPPTRWISIGALLVAQHLCFGNGHLIPLAAAAALVATQGWSPKVRVATSACIGLSAAFLLGQYWFLRSSDPSATGSLWGGVSTYPLRFIGFFLSCLGRAALLFDASVGPVVSYFGAIAIVVLGASLARGDRPFANRLAFALFWLATTAAIVPLARPTSAEIIYYYNCLALPPSLLVVFLVGEAAIRRMGWPGTGKADWLARAFLVGIGLVAFADQRLVGIFESRNVKNKAAMAQALQSAKGYEPFDDPVIDVPALSSGAVSAYRTWREHALLPDLNRY